MKEQPTTSGPTIAVVKSASITLRANGAMLSLFAMLRPDGTAVTSVTTKESADGKPTRGMSKPHADMSTARAHIASLAKAAEGLGWQRGPRFAAPKPDAFSKLPTVPKTLA